MKAAACLLAVFLLAAHALAWETLRGCRLLPNEFNDGDSFHVEHGGQEYIFRLYFADCPESSMQVDERVTQQAEDFGVAEAAVLKAGKDAARFTEQALRKPFTVTTRFQKAMGASKIDRHYAMIRTADGKDLGMLLMEAGLARAHGTEATVPQAPTMADYRRMEERARRGGYGIFGGKRVAKGQSYQPEDVEEEPEPAPEPKEEFSVTDAAFARITNTPAMTTEVVVQVPGVPSSVRPGTTSATPPPPKEPTVSQAPSTTERLNINKATMEELDMLPGIGPKTAAAIIEGRPYDKVEDLQRVPGIGPKRFEAIAPLVTE